MEARAREISLFRFVEIIWLAQFYEREINYWPITGDSISRALFPLRGRYCCVASCAASAVALCKLRIRYPSWLLSCATMSVRALLSQSCRQQPRHEWIFFPDNYALMRISRRCTNYERHSHLISFLSTFECTRLPSATPGQVLNVRISEKLFRGGIELRAILVQRILLIVFDENSSCVCLCLSCSSTKTGNGYLVGNNIIRGSNCGDGELIGIILSEVINLNYLVSWIL